MSGHRALKASYTALTGLPRNERQSLPAKIRQAIALASREQEKGS
jgi:hypothetical protein